ncbi:peroxisome bioproteinsis factor 10 [Neopestalotiopsis sp. 37M]|nr:peroxisome bioproteinsis factor 10 [Neopestalotiopsis sp. 37M]
MAAAAVASSSHAATLPSSPYPFAFAPDIIRAHQKDVYFQGVLTSQLSDLHRDLLGSRSQHGWTAETKTIADLLYLCLTTLIGNRTLGEEYCNIVQVEGQSGALPTLSKRAAYIAGSIVLPYALGKVLPRLRAKIRARLERNMARTRIQGEKKLKSWSFKIQSYIHANLATITSPESAKALSLVLFYFSGSYYEIAKRLTGLRYIFTHKVDENAERIGYEVLGVLLVVQFAVQGYLHIQSTLSGAQVAQERERLAYSGPDVSLNEHAYSSNNALLAATGSSKPQAQVDLAAATHTPILGRPRHDLAEEKTMAWIKGDQNRKCTLCLEELKDPSATQYVNVWCNTYYL